MSTTSTLLGVGIFLLGVLVAALAAFALAYFRFGKSQPRSDEAAATLQGVSQSVNQINVQVATFVKKLAHIEQAQAGTSQGVGSLSASSAAALSELAVYPVSARHFRGGGVTC